MAIVDEIIEKPTTIYGVIYEDKEGKRTKALIEATSLKNLAKRLTYMQVTHVLEVYTMREISTASHRAKKVKRYMSRSMNT